MRILSILLCCAAVSGCATLKSVLLPTAVACAPKDSPSPPTTTSNAALQLLDDRAFVLRIASERLDLISYSQQADAIIQACKQ